MAEEFNDLSFGDETRRNGDYVLFPVDSDESGDVQEGDVVAVGTNGNLVPAAAGDNIVGVLYTFQYFGDSSNGQQIDYDRDATVKVGGTVKAHVEETVSAGDTLAADGGQFAAGEDDAAVANYQALSNAEEQVGGPRNESQHGNPDREGDSFAEVRLR